MISRTHTAAHGSLLSYTAGFVLALLTTLFAFWAARNLGSAALPAIIIAALLQVFVQLKFFLHLGSGSERSWLTVGGFTLLVIGIMVGGTLWIMHNLMHLHMHAPAATDLYENGVVAPQYELK